MYTPDFLNRAGQANRVSMTIIDTLPQDCYNPCNKTDVDSRRQA